MSNKSNNQGRAFEFICLLSLHAAINKIRPAQIIRDNSGYDAAKTAWDGIDISQQQLMTLSAQSTINTIFELEPNLIEEGQDMLSLYIQKDVRGVVADVRDIIIERKDIVWKIGLSIKHNHMAVKHSRLSKNLDFGEKWYGIKCSNTYWDKVKPIFAFLESGKQKGIYFKELESKEDDIYVPLLNAFIKEVKQRVSENNTVPKKLVEYLLSKYDFYKVISLDSKRITTIQSFNMYGTLNKSSKIKAPDITVPFIELPTALLHIGFKPESKTTVLMCFDNGWQFSFRIHNASDIFRAVNEI